MNRTLAPIFAGPSFPTIMEERNQQKRPVYEDGEKIPLFNLSSTVKIKLAFFSAVKVKGIKLVFFQI